MEEGEFDNRASRQRVPGRVGLTLGYVLMLVAAVALFLLIRAYGETLPRPTDAAELRRPHRPRSRATTRTLRDCRRRQENGSPCQ